MACILAQITLINIYISFLDFIQFMMIFVSRSSLYINVFVVPYIGFFDNRIRFTIHLVR